MFAEESSVEPAVDPPASLLTQDFDVEKHAARNKKLRDNHKQSRSLH